MSEGSSSSNASSKVIPFSLAFPLLMIGFGGCIDDGCQGAINAQSSAVYQAAEYGGWIDDKDFDSGN